MRRRFFMPVLMSLTLALSACGSFNSSLDDDEDIEDEDEDEDDDEDEKENKAATESTDLEDDQTPTGSGKGTQKAVTIASHKVTAEFADNENLTSTGSYPEIIVNEDFMMDYPKFWAAMTTFSDSIGESAVEDIKTFGYGAPGEDEASYHYDIEAEVLRLDDKVFTAKFEEDYDWSYTEDYDSYYYYVNYDINTGKRIWSDAFFAEKEGLAQVLYDTVVATYPREKDLVNETNEEGIPIALDYITSMVDYDYLPCCIVGDELVIHFGSYSIMDNDNFYDITIPVDDLKDYLNPDYIEDTTGNVEDKVEYTEVIDDTYEGKLYIYEDGTPENEEQEEIHVSTPEELVNAIAPNTHIILESGKYDISDYVLEDNPDVDNEYWGYTSWWGEYGVCNVYNMTIEGEDPDDRPEIVIKSAFYDVFVLDQCSNITLNNLIIGHDAKKGDCSANVLAVMNSNGITGNNLDLYGCGAYGLMCMASNGVYLYDSCIHDCTYGIVELFDDSSDICFYDCDFIDNREYTLIENGYNIGYIYFTNCKFEGNEGDLFSLYAEPDYITFTDCEFGDEEREFLDEHFDMVIYYEDGGAG